MSRRTLLSATAAVLLFVACVGIGTPNAIAGTVVVSSGPANYCKPALPLFEGRIRTRPLAVQNESDVPVFITCSMAAENATLPVDEVETIQFLMFFSNKNASGAITVRCTGISGFDGGSGGNILVPGTVTLTASERGFMRFTADDFSEVGIFPDLVSFSCMLPPGGAINDMHMTRF